jgi:hypothetical protein
MFLTAEESVNTWKMEGMYSLYYTSCKIRIGELLKGNPTIGEFFELMYSYNFVLVEQFAGSELLFVFYEYKRLNLGQVLA